MRVGDWLRHFGGEIKKRKRKKKKQEFWNRAASHTRKLPICGLSSPLGPQHPPEAGAAPVALRRLSSLRQRGRAPYGAPSPWPETILCPWPPLYKYTPQDRVLLPSLQREAGGLKPPRSRGGANGRGEAGSGARCDGGRAATPGPRAAGTAPAALPRPC